MLVHSSLMTGKLNLTWSVGHRQTHVGKLICESKYYNISYTIFFKETENCLKFRWNLPKLF